MKTTILNREKEDETPDNINLTNTGINKPINTGINKPSNTSINKPTNLGINLTIIMGNKWKIEILTHIVV